MLNIQRAYQTATLMSLEVNYLEFLILNYLISVSSSCIVKKKILCSYMARMHCLSLLGFRISMFLNAGAASTFTFFYHI